MSSIYSSLPDPRGDLPETRSEFNELVNFLISDKIKAKVDFGYSEKKTVDELTSEIIKRQKELRLFHFGGHSGTSGLQFTDAEFNEEHVSNFFNTICAEESNIDCVFLNGCENENIVNKLSNVPVVIGTKSKIEDKVARKFTMDFITALIGGEKTYKQAYLIAQAAKNEKPQIVDRTSAMRGIKIPDTVEPLNDYFMVINKAGVADRKFPFKRGRINWTKYLLIFFVAVALFLGYLFKDSIEKIVRGYTCAGIEPAEGKCNVVIADFITDEGFNFSGYLAQAIISDSILQKHLNPINIVGFNTVIDKNRVKQERLPSYCEYDFNLTGNVLKEGEQLRAKFIIFPNTTGDTITEAFEYFMNYKTDLDTMISTLNEHNAKQFVLIEMCMSCARKRGEKEFLLSLRSQIEALDPLHASVMYQRLQYSMAELNLHFSDTTAALVALDKMRNAAGNDLALLAVERKISLYTGSNKILRTYETQSELISEIQARVQNPGKYELNADQRQYEVGENKVRLTRAEFVLKNQEGALKEYISIAIQDLEYLQKIKFQDRDFSRELTQLKGEKTEDVKIDPKEEFYFNGRVFSDNGKSLEGATVSFGDLKKRTDGKGQFDFGMFIKSTVIGKQLHISHKGFQDKSIEIQEATIGKIVLSVKIPLEKYKVILHGLKINEAEYRKALSSLKSAGYPLDTQHSENFSAPPKGFAKTSTIVYYDERNKKRAVALASQLKEWTGEAFKVQQEQEPPVTIGIERVHTSTEDIHIQWVGIK